MSFAKIAAFGPVALGVCVLAGCGSDTRAVNPPPQQPMPASASPSAAGGPVAHADTLATPTMGQFRSSLTTAQQQIDGTLKSLTALTDPNQQDLRGAYDKYCDNLARMQENAENMKRQADAMRESRDTYFASWEEKATDIDNPTIRASAEARRKRLRDAHEQIATAAGDAKDAYGPFMKDLQDIKKYLATDLSKSSVADLGQAAKKVQGDGAALKTKLDTIGKALDTVQGPPA
jgi:chromosome segregation ATPase